MLDILKQIAGILWPLVGGHGTEANPLELAERAAKKLRYLEEQLDEARADKSPKP